MYMHISEAIYMYTYMYVYTYIFLESQHSGNDLVLCTDTASVTTAIETLTKADYPDLFVHGDFAIHQSTPFVSSGGF